CAAVREERLHRAALAAEKMERVAPGPGIRRVAHRAQGLVLGKGPAAVVAVNGAVGEVYVVFAADFITPGTTPTDSHFLTPPPPPLIGVDIRIRKKIVTVILSAAKDDARIKSTHRSARCALHSPPPYS